MPTHKLTIELIPKTAWHHNMRKALSTDAWDRLRKMVYAQSGHRCAICGDDAAQLHCHEVWQYQDATHVQTLTGFLALCSWCHHVKHLGMAQILAKQGKLDFADVVAHFCRVNACSRADFDRAQEEAAQQWLARSQHPWTTDLGAYAPLVTGKQR